MPSNSGRAMLRWLRRASAHSTALFCALLLAPAGTHLSAQETLPANELRLNGTTENRATTTTIPLSLALETRGDLTLQSVPMEKALITIGASWRVNITVGKDVRGTVSCVYRQAKLREVLDAILLANGYSYRAVGDSLVVLNAKEVGSANPLFQSVTIPITHSDVQEIFDGAKLLKSSQGNVHALTSARSILVVDFADRVAAIQAFVARMDAAAARANGGIPAESYHRLQVAYFHTQYIPVNNAKEPLNAVLSEMGRVATMPRENRMIVTDYASNIEMVRKVLDKIDRPQPQVRITALIYDISLQDLEQLGFNWNHAAKGNSLNAAGDPNQVFSFDSITKLPFGATELGNNMVVQSLTDNFDITVVGVALQNANDARLLANPNVTVMDNELADMSSVTQIPFQQITQSELGGQIGTTSFKDVGITLHVTPTVAADGTIKLVVDQEFSRVAGFTENDSQPIIDTRIANTTVRVANRQTLVIGGLRQRSDTGDFNGIPILKDLWLVGPLFRSRDTVVRESELVIFLMPEIVDYGENHLPREYLANETINCRLDRIPMAEGCGGPGSCVSCDPTSRGLRALPPVGGEPSFAAAPGPAIQEANSPLVGKVPFRPGFEDRYRAPGGTDARRRSLRDLSPQEPAPDESKVSVFKKLFSKKP